MWISLAAIFFVAWWIVLFVVLPWGIRTQSDEGEVVMGTVPSAPVRPMLVRKAIATTIVAAVVTFGFWLAFFHYGIDLEWMAERFGFTPG